MNEVFDLRRLWLLVRNDAIADYRPLLLVAATIAAIMLLGSMWSVAYSNQSPDYYTGWFYGSLFVWGTIQASFSFEELHDKTKNEAFLLLPASALEKTVARLLSAAVLFPAFVLIFLTLTSAAVEGINSLTFGRRNGLFDPLESAVWRPLPHFLVAVSLFFAGAAWFRKLRFIKTAFALAAIPIALGIIGGVVGDLVFTEMFPPVVESERDIYNYYLAHQGLFDALLVVLQVLYYAGLPVLCWFIAWLRVQETQVSHGL